MKTFHALHDMGIGSSTLDALWDQRLVAIHYPDAPIIVLRERIHYGKTPPLGEWPF
jgi:hypothetical protein